MISLTNNPHLRKCLGREGGGGEGSTGRVSGED